MQIQTQRGDASPGDTRGPLTFVSGSLLASSLFDAPSQGRGGDDRHAQALLRIWQSAERRLGPASGATAVLDAVTRPVAAWLGFALPPAHLLRTRAAITGVLTAASMRIAVVTLPWQASLDGAWAAALATGATTMSRWCVMVNGTTVRLVDARRPWARAHADLDLGVAGRDAGAAAALARALHARAFAGSPSQLDRWLAESARLASRASGSIDRGSRQAIAALTDALSKAHRLPASLARHPEPDRDVQAVTWLYRVLFLLYAEARGVVPTWHPIYRDAYALAPVCEQITRGTTPRGLAPMLSAVMRLARLGCDVDALRVTAFNGRLFDPRQAPQLERLELDDRVLADVLRGLTSQPAIRGRGRVRVRYEDLGVEQLGAIYERLLDERATQPSRTLRAVGSRRKASGSFYTPRPLTEYLVRRTLAPLVEAATPDRILALRVLDPAMGSGAMLVAACHFLAHAYERALVEHGVCRAGDLDPAERARIRRTVAQRCLFGVDANPMAVELARMSLWLTTLATDRPLSFFDHHLRVGNSLLGATPADVIRSPVTGRATTHSRAGSLFPEFDPLDALRAAMPERLRLVSLPDDTVSAVREKAQLFAALESPRSPLNGWRRALDTWCAWASWPQAERVSPQLWRDLIAVALGRPGLLAPHIHGAWDARVREHAARHRLLHWPLAFPEVFVDRDGAPRPDAGFDAIVGNPPWDVVRGDGGTSRDAAATTTAFVRQAGIYTGAHEAHLNAYQLFVERSLQLLSPTGRLGMVVPWGLLADQGAGATRVALFDRCRIDAVVGFDNRRGVFAIHRSVRFALVTAAAGGRTDRVPARFGERTTDGVERVPATGCAPSDFPLVFTREGLLDLSGPSRALPHVESREDLAVLERLSAAFPPLSSADGWGLTFGREFNATDDAALFNGDSHQWPVIEGKHIAPFSVDAAAATRFVDPAIVRARLGRIPTIGHDRLAYRDVASSTNRLTLIAAIVPAQAVTTHTLFCSRVRLDADAQWVVCALLNSLVANWLVRRWVSTHVTTAIVQRLPVPVVPASDRAFGELARLARRCADDGVGSATWTALQEATRRAYGLGDDAWQHVRKDFAWLPGGPGRR